VLPVSSEVVPNGRSARTTAAGHTFLNNRCGSMQNATSLVTVFEYVPRGKTDEAVQGPLPHLSTHMPVGKTSGFLECHSQNNMDVWSQEMHTPSWNNENGVGDWFCYTCFARLWAFVVVTNVKYAIALASQMMQCVRMFAQSMLNN